MQLDSPVAWQFCSRGPPDPWGGGGGGKRGRKPADTKKQRGPGKTQGGRPPGPPPHATGLQLDKTESFSLAANAIFGFTIWAVFI